MMYVSGETAEASPETTGMIEEIVRQQVIEMVSLYPLLAEHIIDSLSFGNALNKPRGGVADQYLLMT